MRGPLNITIWGLSAAGALLAAGAADAQAIEFRDIAARVVIVPEQRPDVQVVFLKTNPRLPMRVVQSFGRTVVENTHWVWWMFSSRTNCGGGDADPTTYVPRAGPVAYSDLPQIVVRVPMDADIKAGGAIYGQVGRSHSLKLTAAGCGAWTVADVADRMEITFAGSGQLHTGAAGSATLNIAGASTATSTNIQNGLSIEIAGVGDVHMAQASGPVGVHLAGGGEVRIDGGRASTLDVHIAGSGAVNYGGTADSLNADIAGSGEIRAAKVTGDVHKFIAGSGVVTIGE